MKPIVSNTGPVLHLVEIGALDLLHVADVHIPSSVQRELERCLPDWNASRPPWLTVVEPEASFVARTQPWVDAGVIHAAEAAAIALSLQMDVGWFLTDDAAARLVGRSVGLEVHGSLGVVLWAAALGQLDQAQADLMLDHLAGSSLWVSARVLSEARVALKEMFS